MYITRAIRVANGSFAKTIYNDKTVESPFMLTVRFESERAALMLGRALGVETGMITLTKCTALSRTFPCWI